MMQLTADVLTHRQHQVLEAICQFKAEKGYAPTVRELGQLLQVSSTCTIQRHIEALHRKGYLSREPGKARCLVVGIKPGKLIKKSASLK